MVDLFTIKLILSFLVGGAYAIVATIIADKLGSKIGGLISGLPSTTLFGLLFIAWTQNTRATVEATTLIPAVIGIACLFLITYVLFFRKGFWVAIFLSFIVWILFTLELFSLNLTNFFLSVLVFCLCFLITYVIVNKILKIKSVKGNTIKYSAKLLFVRGFITGFVIVISVFIAKFGGPVLGGVFTTFPAMFSSVLLITYHAHGQAFSAGVAKSSLFAWISTTIFVIVFRYTVIPFGIVGGTSVALLVSYFSAYLLYEFVLKKHE